MATGAKQVKAGQAYVELATRDRALIRGLNAAQARLRAFAAQANKIGDTMMRVGKQMATFGAALSAPFAISTFVTAEFEKSMSRVLALTQATPEEFKAMSDAAKKMGRETVFSASQAADAMGFFALAGFKTKQILDALRPTLDLAAAGQIEIAEAADIVAKIMAGMGLEAEDLARAVDVLTKGMTTANTDVRQLGEAMKYVGPIAKSVNLSIEETVAMIQALSNAGIQADMAGTTLRGAILALTSPSAEAAKWMAQLGIQTKDAQGNFLPLIEIIRQFEKALDGMGTAERAEIIGRIFPARQAVGVIELISQGADRLAEMKRALEEAGGTAARVAGTQIDNLAGDVIILKSAVEGLAIAIGEALTKPLRIVAQGFTKVVGQLAAFAEANRGLTMTLAAAAVSITAAGVGLIGLGLTFKVMAVAASGLAAALGVVKIAILAITSPIGIAIAAVGALAAAFLLYTETGGKALDWLKGKFGAIASFAKESFGGISDALAAGDIALAAKVLWASLKVAWERGTLELRKLWETFKGWFIKTAYGAFYGALAAWEIIQHGLSVAWIETTAFLGRTWTRFTSLLKSTWESTQSWLEDRWHDLFSLFDETYDADAAKAMNARASKQAIAAIEAEEQRRIAENTRLLDAQRKESARQHEQNMAQIGKDANDAMAAVDAAGATAISEAQKQFEEARREWEKAREDAAKARAEFGQDKGPESSEAPGAPDQQRFADLIKSMMAGAGVMKQAASVRGTFSAFEAMGLGAQSTGEKIAKATEETAKNTRKIALNLNGIPTLQFA